MKAWKVTAENAIELQDMGQQSVSDGCVKLKMLSALICTHESSAYQAGKPIIVGRNGVGLVTETGAGVTSFKRGDFAYIRPVSACGVCSHCRAGKKGECEHSYTYGRTEDGVLRDFIVVPQSDLVLLPPKVSPEEGVFVESVAVAIATLDALKLEKGEHVVIMGATRIGLIIAQVALYYQAVPIVVDLREDRLAVAEKLGIYYTVNAVESDPVKKVFSFTCGKMAEAMCYCLLSDLPVQRSFDCLSRAGRAAVVGFDDVKENVSFNFMPLLEKNITVSSVASAEDNYLSAVNMLASRSVDVKSLIARHVPFKNAGVAISEIAAESNKFTAVIVDIDKL